MSKETEGPGQVEDAHFGPGIFLDILLVLMNRMYIRIDLL